MTTIIRDSILVCLALFTTACVDYGPVNDGSESGSMDSGSDDPTGGSLLGTYFICYNDTNYQVNAGGVPFYFQAMNACVVLEDPVNWMSPENQEKILNACSQVCQASYGGKNNHCVDSGWKGAEPVYENVLESTCDPDQYGGPEYGGGILWLDGVQSPDREVACDLHGTCGDLFGPDIAKQLKSGRTPDDGESSGAQQSIELHLSVESNTMSELRLDGNMDFTQVACGESACPFYLGDADIVQAEGHWRIALDLGALGRVDKRLSNARIKLARPSLGILLANGQLAFPAESLQFRVDAEITGAPHPFVENGEQSFWLANPTVVLGRLIDGALEIDMEIPSEFGPFHLSTRRCGE